MRKIEYSSSFNTSIAIKRPETGKRLNKSADLCEAKAREPSRIVVATVNSESGLYILLYL